MFYTWKKITDPDTEWINGKSGGWTAHKFCTPGEGGTPVFEVDFSSVVPAGTKAVRVFLYNMTAAGWVWGRKSGDTNISNNPSTPQEYSHVLGGLMAGNALQVVLWLSSAYKAQIAVSNVDQDIYFAYPIEYLS